MIALAIHGRRATGVNIWAEAISSNRRAADGVTGATLLDGDVTKLTQPPVDSPIGLVLDVSSRFSLHTDTKPNDDREYCGRAAAGAGRPHNPLSGVRKGNR